MRYATDFCTIDKFLIMKMLGRIDHRHNFAKVVKKIDDDQALNAIILPP